MNFHLSEVLEKARKGMQTPGAGILILMPATVVMVLVILSGLELAGLGFHSVSTLVDVAKWADEHLGARWTTWTTLVLSVLAIPYFASAAWWLGERTERAKIAASDKLTNAVTDAVDQAVTAIKAVTKETSDAQMRALELPTKLTEHFGMELRIQSRQAELAAFQAALTDYRNSVEKMKNGGKLDFWPSGSVLELTPRNLEPMWGLKAFGLLASLNANLEMPAVDIPWRSPQYISRQIDPPAGSDKIIGYPRHRDPYVFDPEVNELFLRDHEINVGVLENHSQSTVAKVEELRRNWADGKKALTEALRSSGLRR